MSGEGNGAIDRAAAEGRAQGLDTGWAVSGYLISGMIAYGGIGWLIGRAVHVALLFPLGMLAGLAFSIGFIIYRYGKQGHGGMSHGGTGQWNTGEMAPPRKRGVPGGRPPGLARKDDR